MNAPSAPTQVDFHFDVMCPFAYQTSKWMRVVRDHADVDVTWRFFSLEEVNRAEGKKHPWEREWSYGWSMMRIAAHLRRSSMDDVDRWYERAGRALHEDGLRPHQPAVARHLLEELGLDPSIVDDAIADDSTHDEVRADHERVIAAGGFGVPTLFFGDQCFFGPVILDPPLDPDPALRLWAMVTTWLEFPHLYEMQRPKTPADGAYIAETFKPYLEARDWVSIDRGRVIDFDRLRGDA